MKTGQFEPNSVAAGDSIELGRPLAQEMHAMPLERLGPGHHCSPRAEQGSAVVGETVAGNAETCPSKIDHAQRWHFQGPLNARTAIMARFLTVHYRVFPSKPNLLCLKCRYLRPARAGRGRPKALPVWWPMRFGNLGPRTAKLCAGKITGIDWTIFAPVKRPHGCTQKKAIGRTKKFHVKTTGVTVGQPGRGASAWGDITKRIGGNRIT